MTRSYASASAFADKNVGTAKTVSVSGITVSGADAANYSANYHRQHDREYHRARADRERDRREQESMTAPRSADGDPLRQPRSPATA